MDRDKLLQIFVTESDELLADLEQGLVGLESDDADGEVINRVFRAAHTLKGNAGFAGVEAIVHLAHVMEDGLDRVRAGTLAASSELVSALLAAVDALRELVAVVASGAVPAMRSEHQALLHRLTLAVEGGTHPREPVAAAEAAVSKTASVPESRVFSVQMKFRPDLFATGQDPALLVLELAELGELISVSVDDSRLPPLEQLEPDQCYLAWEAVLRTTASRSDVESVFLFVAEENEITIQDVSAAHHAGVDITAADKRVGELLIEEGLVRARDVEEAAAAQRRIGDLLIEQGKVAPEAVERVLAKQAAARKVRQSASIRIDTQKLDRVVNLVGELVIAVAQVNRKARDPRVRLEDRVASAEQLDQIGRELQEQVLALRMVPLQETFERFKRAVRDTATELGKYVILETAGAETELDKNVVEQLVDPLKHMVRNCVAHGIEGPAERVACGKSDTGRVYLRAAQREGHIVIEIADDGRGIDPEVVLAKARERGLVPEGKTLSERQVFDLLFLPGFSTAKQVDEISGRGVGLDVVRRNVEQLRGQIEVESVVGRGTTFRIRLPLTLAIIDGMSVRVGESTVTVPLGSVVELIEPSANNLKTIEGEGEVVDVRGDVLPMVRLGEVLALGGTTAHARDRASHDAKIVVVENEGRKFGVFVDRVLGMDQAVIKTLDTSFAVFGRLAPGYERPRGIAGATILGDGTVGLILDVNGLERMAFGAMV
jgi:two-component system chemotaxis sensor kinase CheA